jgi:hypothetical protein
MSAQDWATSKASGSRIEHEIVEKLPVTYVTDDVAAWYDCELTRPATADDLRLGGRVVIPTGSPIEIKGARVRNGADDRGRFYLRKKQHERLEAADGFYLFVVYKPGDAPLRGLLLVPADNVTRILPSWIEPEDRATYAQLAWSQLFDTDSVEGNR